MFIREGINIDEICNGWEFDEDNNEYYVNFPDDTYIIIIIINRDTREVKHQGWTFIDYITSK